jgi:glutamine amidotransferase
MQEEPTFYFLHSYHFLPNEDDLTLAFTDYGKDIVAAVSKGVVNGVQFHPEKSQDYGIQLLKNFISLSA